MIKDIKKYYNRLNLNYTATEEQALLNQKIKIKILRAKLIKKNRLFSGDKKFEIKAQRINLAYSRKIEQVKADTGRVLEYIKANGQLRKKEPIFDTPISSLFNQIAILITSLAIAITCLIYLF